MTTNNIVNVPLSGSSGSGKFVGDTSPSLVTPVLGAATFTSIAFSPTTGGVIGTATNDNVSAGDIGEVISSQITAASPNTVTTATPTNLTSISLTAGDWDVFGSISCTGTTITQYQGAINTTSATLPDNSLLSSGVPLATSTVIGVDVLPQRINVSTNTTVYLVVNFTGTGTLHASGTITARRVR